MKVAEFVAELGFDFRGGGALAQFDNGLRKAEGRLTAFAAAAARLGAVAGAALGAGMVALGKGVIGTTAQFEAFETTLVTIEGSAEKARASMDWIARFARSTPYDVAQVTEAFIRLKSYGIDPVADGTLNKLGDTASAMGKTLMDSVEMYADASTMQFERLKSFGITASQEGNKVTFTWSQNGKDLTKTLTKSGDEIRRFLLDNFGQRFNGAMLRQSKTWSGMMSNLGDAWQDFQLRIGRGGFFESVKNRLANLLDYIGELDENGTLDRWSKSLSNGFKTAVDIMETAFGRLWQIGEKIAGLFDSKSAIWGIVAFAGALVLRAFPLAAGITLVVAGLEDLWAFFEGKQSLIGNFLKDWPQLEAAIRGMGDGFAWLGEQLGPLSGYIVPVLGFAAAIALLAPAIRALSSALLTLTGIKLLGSVIGALGGLKGIPGVPKVPVPGSPPTGPKAPGILPFLGTIGGTILAALGAASFKPLEDDEEARVLKSLADQERKRTVRGNGRGARKMGEDARRPWARDNEGNREPVLHPSLMNENLEPPAEGPSLDDKIGSVGGALDSLIAAIGSRVPIIASAREAETSSMRAFTRYRDNGDFDFDLDAIRAGMDNVNAHLAAMSAQAVAKNVIGPITDARVDSRDQSTSVAVGGVTVNVASPAAAPAAVGAAVGQAVGNAAIPRALINTEPAGW